MRRSCHAMVGWAGLLLLAALGACEARVSVGGRCTSDSECPTALSCQYGRCREGCRLALDCTVGLRCIQAASGGVCSLPEEERCGGDDACAPPLTCPDGRCRVACARPTDCSAGAGCGAGGYCVEPIAGEALDSGLELDSAPTEAGPADAPFGEGGWPTSGHGSLCVAGECGAGLRCADQGDVCEVPGVIPTCRVECGSEEDCPSVGIGVACRCNRCTSLCDPVLDTGCGGDVCRLLPSGGSVSYTECGPAGGSGLHDASCTSDDDCAPEHVCFGGRGCVELCGSDADCRTETCIFDGAIQPLYGETVASIGLCGGPPP